MFLAYIRIFMQSSQLLLICSISEVKNFGTHSLSRVCSLLISCCVLIGCLTALVFVFIKTFRAKTFGTYFWSTYYGELFNGLNKNNKAKWNSFVLLLRRVVMIGFLLFFELLDTIPKLAVVLAFQIC